MRYWPALLLLLLLSISLAACSDQPGAPTPTPTPQPTPAPVLYAITGLVAVGSSSTPISGAILRVVDGPNAGVNAISDGNGRYTISGLTFAGFSVSVTAPNYLSTSRGVPLTAGVTSTTVNFSLLPTTPFTRTGAGNTVFDMPNYFTRVRIVGTYTGFSSNFIARIGGRLVINELVGTFWNLVRYEGVHLTNGGGVVEITSSSGVAWSFTEER